MKYGDEEIGGKHIDYANMRFSGDEAKAREYIPIARNILGTLKHGMSFNNLDQNRKQVKLQDGTIISVSSARGTSDVNQIHIDTTRTRSSKSTSLIIYGYIIRGLCYSAADPGFSQYLYFPVTVGDAVFDPEAGVWPENVVFDNYPDLGAKYETRGEGTCLEVFFAYSYNNYELISSTGPSQVIWDPALPTDPGSWPPLDPGWAWGFYHTCHAYISGPGTDYQPLGTSYDFRYAQNTDPEGSPHPGFSYPGGTTAWTDHYSAYSFRLQGALWFDAINTKYSNQYTQSLADWGNHIFNTAHYVSVNAGYWLRKGFDDFGFASNLGFYIDQSEVLVLSERYQTNLEGETVGQGFLVMVNKEYQARITQTIIDANDYYEYDETGFIPDAGYVTGDFTSDIVLRTLCQESPPTLPDGGILPETPITSSTVFDHVMATFNSSTEEALVTLPTIFNLNCKVKAGYHNISVRRGNLADNYDFSAEVLLYTSNGVFSKKKSIGQFGTGYLSETKITIPIEIPITYEQYLAI